MTPLEKRDLIADRPLPAGYFSRPVHAWRLSGNELLMSSQLVYASRVSGQPKMTRVLRNSSRITSLCAEVLALFALAPPLSAQESARSLPIFYDSALAAQGFPNPLVKARIAGHEAIFIVDSGARKCICGLVCRCCWNPSRKIRLGGSR